MATSMSDLPTGTVTFLFTDLEGSTRLWEEHPEAMKSALARHDEILRGAVEKRDGHVVKTTGDGLHAAFSLAPDAVAAALDAQRALTDEQWTLTEPLKVRMGIHSGSAELRDGDYYGTAVNRAARVAAAAHGGQIVASAVTADLVRDDLAPEAALVDLGEHRLRDLGRPEHIFQVTHPDLPTDFAPLRSLDAYPGNLPLQRTAFVGRAADLAEVRDALDDATVVTLTGVGGVGKTRLALQVAADSVTRYPDGVWFVDLGPVLDASYVPAALVASLALPERRQSTLEESIVAALREKQLLVVLDNCEQVVDAAAELVDTIVESCPKVRILATSREALGVGGEETYEVRPLASPQADAGDATESLLDNDAVRLFAERGRSAKRGFSVTSENAAVVAEICQRLDCIPLAIELAAARLQLMAPVDILARLDERFALLAGGRRTALERHQTLRGAIDWSFTLLDPDEQLLFARLSVFAGGFTLEAAEAVGAGDVVGANDVLTLLGGLVAKSMVITDDTRTGIRYRLLETLRAYAAERLGELDDTARVDAEHAAYFFGFAEAAAPELRGRDDDVWQVRVAAEIDNFRVALAWSRDHGDPEVFVRFVVALAVYWQVIGDSRGGLPWQRAALDCEGAMTAAVRAELLALTGIHVNVIEGIETAVPYFEASLECTRGAGLEPVPRALSQLGILALESNQPDEAISRCEEALVVARERGDDWYELDTLNMLVLSCCLGGDAERGRALADEALVDARRIGNRFLLASALMGGGIARVTQDPADALELFDEAQRTLPVRNINTRGSMHLFAAVAHLLTDGPSEAAQELRSALALMQETGSDYFTSMVISTSVSLLARSAPAIAVALLGALDAYHRNSGIAGAPNDVAQRDRVRTRLERALPADQFAEGWNRGAALSVDEAAALTREELGAFLD